VPTFTLPAPSVRRLAALALLIAVALVLGLRHVGGRAQQAGLRVAPVRVAAAPRRAAAAASLLVVDVEGAVRRPGLVRLRSGARVADAVARAGGFGRKADRSGVNLAATLADGQQVLVPRVGAAGAGAGAGAAGGAASATSGPISLSSATAEQLDTLPGIGPVTAQKIVAFREQHGPFHAVDELDAIPGIGPARLAELQGLVTP
jgi:competence protein ComEA